MYKVILFDLDGTLTDKNKNILEERAKLEKISLEWNSVYNYIIKGD